MSNPNQLNPGGKTQLQSNTVRVLIVGIVALVASFGVKWAVNDTDIDHIAEAVAAAVPLVSMALAWFFRVRATERIVPNPNDCVMPRRPGVPVLLLAVLSAAGFALPFVALIVALPGCVSRPADVSPKAWKFIQRQDAYSNTLVGVTVARIAGVIPDPVARRIESARLAAAVALDRYRANALNEPELTAAMKRLDQAVDESGQRERVDAEKAKAAKARLRAAEAYTGDPAALGASDAYRRDAEAGWLATL